MKRKYLGLSVLTAGITGLFLAGGVACGQIGSECDPLWRNLGCGPQIPVEKTSVPDYARDCEESWREQAAPVAVAPVAVAPVAVAPVADMSVEDAAFAEVETTVLSQAEGQAGEPSIADGPASEDSDYWYDSDTNQYHRYRFAENTADTPNESAWVDNFEKMFEIEHAVTEGQPTVDVVDEPMLVEEPALPSPDVLLSAARVLDRAGSVLQTLSRHLTEMAERELAKASGGNMHR